VRAGQRLDRVGLVGEAGDVRAVAGHQPGPGGVREERSAAGTGAQQPVAGGGQRLLDVRLGAGGGQRGQHPGGLDGVPRAAVGVERGHPAERVGQLGVPAVGGGPRDKGRVAAVGDLRQPLDQQPGELLGGVPAEDRGAAFRRQPEHAQDGDGRVPGAGAPVLQGRPRVPGGRLVRGGGPGEDEGVAFRFVHRGQARLRQCQQPRPQRVQRRIIAA